MLTIFRTQQKDRENRPNEPESGMTAPSTESISHPTPAPNPSIVHPRQPIQTQPMMDPMKSSVIGGSTTIGKDLVFEGNVQGKGSIRVEGDFRGTLEVQNEVIIGKGGTVTGDIKADVVTVEGDLKGNVEARQKISINVTGTMLGDIIAPRVVVASGAVYKGRIDMEAALKKQQSDQKKEPITKVATPEPKPVVETQPPFKSPESPKTIPGPPPK
ncbi:polymer-forming cytoskeletal protein [bacterium]|nr:polymer-forming cytoskeletal protein [candidate division CSSED10-310 bacterium]